VAHPQKITYLALYISLLLIYVGGVPAHAQNAGDACSPTKFTSPIWVASGTGGGGSYLVCDGSNWALLYSVDTDGAMMIGQATGASCAAGTEGMIRYNSTAKNIETCDGTLWVGVSADAEGGVYDIAVFMPSTPNNGASIRVVLPRAIRLPASLTNSQCVSSVAADSPTTITLNKVVSGTSTAIGTAVWSASARTCSFSFSSDRDFAIGDVLEFSFPAIADPDLADISITLAGAKL